MVADKKHVLFLCKHQMDACQFVVKSLTVFLFGASYFSSQYLPSCNIYFKYDQIQKFCKLNIEKKQNKPLGQRLLCPWN